MDLIYEKVKFMPHCISEPDQLDKFLENIQLQKAIVLCVKDWYFKNF